MKKNISINISGIIFHIEEDGYERLEKYLASIKQYFSAFDESEEIIMDIDQKRGRTKAKDVPPHS